MKIYFPSREIHDMTDTTVDVVSTSATTADASPNLCDFIYQNSLSQNVALIEIKTPCTGIIGGQYR